MGKLDALLEKAQKTMGLDIRTAREQCKLDRITLDSVGLNYILGGGFGKGRIYVLSGPFSGGKSSLATYLACQVQKYSDKKNVVYMDFEYSFDTDHAEEMGLDIDNNFKMVRPKSGEDCYNLIQDIADTGEVGLIILDSISALSSNAQLEDDNLSGFSGSKNAIVNSNGLKKILPHLNANKCSMIIICQERANVGSMYGPDFTISSGGKATLFYSSFNARVTRTDDIIDEKTKEIVGLNIRVRNTKNKLGIPKRDANLKLYFKGGINSEEEVLDYIVQLGVVNKNGSMYEFDKDKFSFAEDMGRIRGLDNVKEYLINHPEAFKEVKTVVNTLVYDHTIIDEQEKAYSEEDEKIMKIYEDAGAV